jgi:hypothetical protein
MVQVHLSERMIGQGSGVNAAEACSYKTKVLYVRTSPAMLVHLLFNWPVFCDQDPFHFWKTLSAK